MISLEHIVPKGATPSEVSVLIVHHLFPDWSKKQIAAMVGFKNHQRPRAVQKIFKKYNLIVVKYQDIEEKRTLVRIEA